MDFIVLEPWAIAAESLSDPLQRVAFWDALAGYAVHGREPDPKDGVGIMAVAMARRIIDKHKVRSEAGRKGGKANAKQTESKDEANAKQNESKDEANAKQNEANAKQTGTRKNERMNESSTAHARGTRITPSLSDVLSAAESSNWMQYAPGWTVDQMRDACREIHDELTAHGWMDAQGRTLKNWRAFFTKAISEKKIYAARAEASSVPVFKFNPEAM